MEEELVDDLVVFAKGIYTSVSFNKKGPSVYEIRNRCVKLQARHGAGALPELIVIDGPLQQPLSDYISETGNNETWAMPVMGAQESELRAIPKAARVSFPKLNLEDRIEAMAIAVSEAQARKQHAQQLMGSAAAPPKPKANGPSSMQRTASPMQRTASPLHRMPSRSFSQESPMMSSRSVRSVSPLQRMAINRTHSGSRMCINRTHSGQSIGGQSVGGQSVGGQSVGMQSNRSIGAPPMGFGINRTCSTESLASQTAASVPVPRFLSTPQPNSQSLSPLRTRATLSKATGKSQSQISSPLASARSLSPLRRSLSPAPPGMRQPRRSFGVPQNRYAFVQDMKDMNTPRSSKSPPRNRMGKSPPAREVDAARMLIGDLERKLRISYSTGQLQVPPAVAKQTVGALVAPQPVSNASSDTTAPADEHNSESFDTVESSASSQPEAAPEALQSVKSAGRMLDVDRTQPAASITASPMPSAGRMIQASASDQGQLFARRPPAAPKTCLVQMVQSSQRMQTNDMSALHGGSAQTPAPSQHDRSCMQTPTPPAPPPAKWSNRHGGNSYQPSAERVFFASPPLKGRSMTPLTGRSATPLKGRSLTPPQRSVTPPRLTAEDGSHLPKRLLCTTSVQAPVATKITATANLTSALGGFGTPSSPRRAEGITYVAPVGPPGVLPCTDTFLVVPPPPSALEGTLPTATAPGAAGRPLPAAPGAPRQQQQGPPPQAAIPRYASPMVCRRICSRGRSPGPTRSPLLVRRTTSSRGQSPMPLPTVAFNAVAV